MIAETIRAARERRGWTQTQLSKRSGVTQATISRVEGGLQRPSFQTVAALCRALSVDLTEMMNGGEE